MVRGSRCRSWDGRYRRHCAAVAWEIPGYCAKDISGGASRPVSVGNVAITALNRCSCRSAGEAGSTSPVRKASSIGRWSACSCALGLLDMHHRLYGFGNVPRRFEHVQQPVHA